MQDKKQAKLTHGSLEKGVRLLTAFLPDNKELGIVELSSLFEMNRSTVSRMLTVLKRQGLVLQNPDSKKYSLGPLVASLATAYQNSFQSTLTLIAKPYLDDLRNTLHNTVVLALPIDSGMVIAYVTEGLGPIKVVAQLGEKRPFHSTAGGKCLLAYSPVNRIEQVLKTDLPRLTPATIVDPKVLEEELIRIRNRGFSFDSEGHYVGISAFAVPLLDNSGLPVAAITTAGPSNVVLWEKRDFFVEKLKAAAESLRTQLAGEGFA